MNDRLDKELQRAGADLAAAWRDPLAVMSGHWQDRIADWNRVFPGLVAAVGFQSLLWPLWVKHISGDGASTVDAGYSAPPASAGGEVYRFAFGHAGGGVGWVAVGLPGSLDWDRLRPVFADRDVLIALGSLTTESHVVVSGKAPGLLAPLVGRMFPGDQPVGLPVCDCDAVTPMLPDWAGSIRLLEPALATAATAFRAAVPDPAACPSEEVTMAFGRIAWAAWQRLLEDGVIRLTGGPATANKSVLGRLFGPRELAPFRGAMLFRGDHFALWQRLKDAGSGR